LSAAKTIETRELLPHICLLSVREIRKKFGSCLTPGTSICIEQRGRSTKRGFWLSSPSRQAYRGNDRIGPTQDERNTYTKECEAKNCSNGLVVVPPLPRVPFYHDLWSLAGSSDSFSDKVADQCRRRGSENDSV